MVREKLLILSITYPEFSKKYFYRVCIAGITETGELRRIYPVPIKFFLENSKIFEKYNWIEYDRFAKGNSRKESYKISLRNIKKVGPIKINEVVDLIKNKITNLEILSELRDNKDISLGFIKPNNLKITVEILKKRIEKKKDLTSQRTLFNGTIGDLFIPHHVKFDFLCSKSLSCNGHNIICEDIKYWDYFRENLNNKKSYYLNSKKVEIEIINPIKTNPDLIFMMGTHFQFKTWLVISVL